MGFRHKSYNYWFKSTSTILAVILSLFFTVPPQAYAHSFLNLPLPGVMVRPSPAFAPAVIKGIKIYPDQPFRFDFIIDTGEDQLEGDVLKDESAKLIRYFMAALTVPEDELWVNLSPYERDRIIPDEFGQTEMGRDLLAQDYILKQLTASLVYPEDELGQTFWDKVHKQAKAHLGLDQVPMNTLNKIWIVPQKAVVYEYGDTAWVAESYLKVMLENDYLAIQENGRVKIEDGRSEQISIVDSYLSSPVNPPSSEMINQIIREIIIPVIEREVNEGKNFAKLRQIYQSTILAAWFKRNVKKSLFNQAYAKRNKVDGIEIEDKQVREKIYAQYVKAFKKGAYDYIKEDYDPETQSVVSRKYFSGGVEVDEGDVARTERPGAAVVAQNAGNAAGELVTVPTNMDSRDVLSAPTLSDLITQAKAEAENSEATEEERVRAALFVGVYEKKLIPASEEVLKRLYAELKSRGFNPPALRLYLVGGRLQLGNPFRNDEEKVSDLDLVVGVVFPSEESMNNSGWIPSGTPELPFAPGSDPLSVVGDIFSDVVAQVASEFEIPLDMLDAKAGVDTEFEGGSSAVTDPSILLAEWDPDGVLEKRTKRQDSYLSGGAQMELTGNTSVYTSSLPFFLRNTSMGDFLQWILFDRHFLFRGAYAPEFYGRTVDHLAEEALTEQFVQRMGEYKRAINDFRWTARQRVVLVALGQIFLRSLSKGMRFTDERSYAESWATISNREFIFQEIREAITPLNRFGVVYQVNRPRGLTMKADRGGMWGEDHKETVLGSGRVFSTESDLRVRKVYDKSENRWLSEKEIETSMEFKALVDFLQKAINVFWEGIGREDSEMSEAGRSWQEKIEELFEDYDKAFDKDISHDNYQPFDYVLAKEIEEQLALGRNVYLTPIYEQAGKRLQVSEVSSYFSEDGKYRLMVDKDDGGRIDLSNNFSDQIIIEDPQTGEKFYRQMRDVGQNQWEVFSLDNGLDEEVRHFEALELSGGRNKIDVQREMHERAGKTETISGVQFEGEGIDKFQMVPEELGRIAEALGVSEGEVGELIAQALSHLKEQGIDVSAIPGKKITLALVGENDSQHLFEDHADNGFIGINEELLAIAERNKEVARIMFVVGLVHELRHEAGINEESLDMDIELSLKMMKEKNISEMSFSLGLGFSLSLSSFLFYIRSGYVVRSSDGQPVIEEFDGKTRNTSFFFRSSEQWLPQFTSYLEKMIDMKIIHDNRLITMTSLGASTGEEAYSMAILLWKALESKGENPKNWNIEISAYDRDARAVQAIEEALYPDQELGDAFQEMWKTAEDLSRFAPVDQQSQGRYRVMNATLRSWVKPQVADISDESFIIPKSDVIFANNLLMYFSQSDADRVTRMITDFSWGNEGYPSFFTMTERNQTRKTEDNLDQLGGIDLTSTMSGFETEGGGLDFDIPIEFKDFDIDGVKGFTPVILQIVPTNLPLLLGINSEVDIQQLSLK